MEGRTALVRYTPLPYDVTVQANGNIYTFKNHQGVMMCWIDNVDVEAILMYRHQCCGGVNKVPTFKYANDAQIAHWETYK